MKKIELALCIAAALVIALVVVSEAKSIPKDDDVGETRKSLKKAGGKFNPADDEDASDYLDGEEELIKTTKKPGSRSGGLPKSTTSKPSDKSTTKKPSDKSTTKKPSDKSTTKKPLEKSTTKKPSEKSTTKKPSEKTTTSKPSEKPTSLATKELELKEDDDDDEDEDPDDDEEDYENDYEDDDSEVSMSDESESGHLSRWDPPKRSKKRNQMRPSRLRTKHVSRTPRFR